MSLEEALSLCKLSLKRIPVIFAGLLEVHLENEDFEDYTADFEAYASYVTLPCPYASTMETIEYPIMRDVHK